MEITVRPAVREELERVNEEAAAFYEAVGFRTYRRYMEMNV